MKQLNNSPEAVAAVTGLSPAEINRRLAELFHRSGSARSRELRAYPAKRCAAALLQTIDR